MATRIRPLPVLLHSVSASIMLWGYKNLHTIANDAFIRQQKGGHWQYLTIQGLAIACFTMLLGLCGDLFPSIPGFRKAQRTFLMISLPLAIVIASIYWSLLLAFPALILPPAPNSELSSSSEAPLLARIALDLDLALHASPVVALLMEFMVYQEPYSHQDVTYRATALAILAGTWYGAWAEYCATYNETFPYPFLTDNPLKVRLGIYAGATMLAQLSFRVVNALHPGRKKRVKQ